MKKKNQMNKIRSIPYTTKQIYESFIMEMWYELFMVHKNIYFLK